MTSTEQIVFEMDEGFQTSDNFYVKLKGIVKYDENLQKDDVLEAVGKSCQTYISTITLMDALNLIDHDEAANLIAGMGELSPNIEQLEISTVDAVELSDVEQVEVDIDPSLESQKKSMGLIGKLKSVFKR